VWFLARPDQLNPKNLNRESRTNAAHIMRLDMTAPKSVSEQAELADKLQQQLVNPSQDTHNEPDVIQEETPPSAQKAEPAPAAQEQAPAEPAPQPAPPSQDEDYLYWKNRFQVLQGKYNAEVPALRKQVSELEKAVSEAKANQPQIPDQSAPQQVANALGDLSQDEIDEFGPELISLVQRIAGAQVNQSSEQVSSLNEKLSQTQDELKQIKDEKQDDQTSRFWADVQRRVPDFVSINSNPNFLAWLDGIDPTTGLQRQSILQNHQDRLNAQGVAAVFNAFKQTVTQTEQRDPSELQQPHQSNERESVEQNGNTRIWTRVEISEFYRDAAQGKYTPEQKKATEAEIFAAQNSGRVR
jgi:hypothetical protein